MKVGDLVQYDEEPKYRIWLSPTPEPVDSRGTVRVHGGELLIVLEKDSVRKYTRVLTTGGVTGWIYSGYLREA